MILVREVVGDQLRRRRLEQRRTLRDVSHDARVSLGYLSEVERGRKEPSSELLSSICVALGLPLSALLREVSDDLALHELLAVSAPLHSVSAGSRSRVLAEPDATAEAALPGLVVDLAA